MLASMIASIPSPSENQISIGPLDLRAYGFLIALGVLAGVWLSSRRLAKDGLDPEIMPNMALWVLPAAIIGARAYFVFTNWGRFSNDLPAAVRIWEGGLGIPGGVALGAAAGVLWLRRNDVPMAPVFTAAALGLPLGQIIGRFGNWFNQELYGRPTDLPWGLEIDEAHRVSGYETNELFHPTFAYEVIWNIALLGVLLRIDKSGRLRSGALFAIYLIGYGIGRILIETVRIDPVNTLLGVRFNIWTMTFVVIAALIYLKRYGLNRDGVAPLGSEDDPDAAPTKPQAPFVGPNRKKGQVLASKSATAAKATAGATATKERTESSDASQPGGADSDEETDRGASGSGKTSSERAKDRAAKAQSSAKRAKERAAEAKAKAEKAADKREG